MLQADITFFLPLLSLGHIAYHRRVGRYGVQTGIAQMVVCLYSESVQDQVVCVDRGLSIIRCIRGMRRVFSFVEIVVLLESVLVPTWSISGFGKVVHVPIPLYVHYVIT